MVRKYFEESFILLCTKLLKLALVDYQVFMKKMAFLCKKVAKKFGQFKKKQYLCTRFAPEVSELRKWQKIKLKNVMLKISHLQRK